MNYFTSDLSEMKREIVNFSNYLTKNCQVKHESNFLLDMLYGISASGDVKLSNIARELKEPIKLDNTIERLSIRATKGFSEEDIIRENYRSFVRKQISKKPIVLFDNSDITKIYGKKFEDLDIVVDASDPKKTKRPGYHVVNAVVLTEKQKQPLPIYSSIVSTKSPDFKSMNTETYKSIDEVSKVVQGPYTGVFDRGYDDKNFLDY